MKLFHDFQIVADSDIWYLNYFESINVTDTYLQTQRQPKNCPCSPLIPAVWLTFNWWLIKARPCIPREPQSLLYHNQAANTCTNFATSSFNWNATNRILHYNRINVSAVMSRSICILERLYGEILSRQDVTVWKWMDFAELQDTMEGQTLYTSSMFPTSAESPMNLRDHLQRDFPTLHPANAEAARPKMSSLSRISLLYVRDVCRALFVLY
jgi:hypothetical protein